MRQSENYQLNLPEAEDAADIEKVSEAIEDIDGILADKLDADTDINMASGKVLHSDSELRFTAGGVAEQGTPSYAQRIGLFGVPTIYLDDDLVGQFANIIPDMRIIAYLTQLGWNQSVLGNV